MITSNNVKIYVSNWLAGTGKQVGYIKRFKASIKNTVYDYKYIGGSEPRYGNMTISGSFEQGYINIKDLKRFIGASIPIGVIMTRDAMTYVLKTLTFTLNIYGEDGEEYISIGGALLENIDLEITEGDYVRISGTFRASEIYL